MLPVQTFVRHMKVAVMHLSVMERPAFQKHTIFSKLFTEVEEKLLSKTDHRPWPLPSRPWVMAMRWHDLLFLHWPVVPDLIRPLIPQGLELDTFDGSAWIGVVPFRMSGVRPHGFPRFAGLAFQELNVRTYVWSPGRSGAWFFSLDGGESACG